MAAAAAVQLGCPTHSIANSNLRRRPSELALCRSSTNSDTSSVSSTTDEQPQYLKKMSRKAQRPPRPLIKLSTSDSRYHGEWTSEYALTLSELRLSDLVSHDGDKDADVLVGLSVQKHAGFGFSVEGRVCTSFTSVCSSCFCTYQREIDTSFNVWVLPASRSRNRNNELELPEIGAIDPSLSVPALPYITLHGISFHVIYVKPGSEADLDSLIRDTIRLTASAKDTCSETCERSTPRWQYTDCKKSLDERWSKLLQIKRSIK